LCQLAITDNPTSTTSTTTSNTSAQSTDVNLVQTSKSNQTSGRKNRNRRKKNAPTEQSELNAKEPNTGGNKGKKKLKFPCLACQADHFTRHYSRLADVQKYVEQSKNPPLVLLTNAFPTKHQQMVAQISTQQPANPSAATPSGASSSSVNILMADSIDLTA
jgi:ribosomal protein L44E